MAGIDVRVFLADELENPLPEVVRKGHGVGLVAHADAFQAVPAGVFERVADDALDAFERIHILLNGDLVQRVLFEEPANANIKSLGVFAENHETNVFFGAIAQRSEALVKQFDGSGVDIEVQLEAKAQQDIGGMLIRRHAGIAKRAEKDGIEFVAEHFDGARGQRNALAQVLVRAPIQFDKFEWPPSATSHGFQHFDGLRCNLCPDAVAGYYRDSSRGAAASQRNAGQGLASSTAGIRAARKLRGLERLSFKRLRSSRPAILPSKPCCAPALPGASEVYGAPRTLRLGARPLEVARPSPLRPGVLFAL